MYTLMSSFAQLTSIKHSCAHWPRTGAFRTIEHGGLFDWTNAVRLHYHGRRAEHGRLGTRYAALRHAVLRHVHVPTQVLITDARAEALGLWRWALPQL